MNEILKRPLFSVGSYSITLELLIELLMVYLLTLLLLFIFKRFITRKTEHDHRRRQSMYQLLKYFIWVIAITIMLKVAQIDVTLMLAGSAALLVGLGLGLQQIFNDLVSGLFLLYEGTVRVGDVMEVDGIVGQVQQINLRTSVILSRDRTNIIVPNHKFITENVINWSHDDMYRRFAINVGVAYESDPELVKSILFECASHHPDVIHDDEAMKPNVRLMNFGDSALDFELLFWSQNIFMIENTRSELRFMISKAFKEKGITIPFPQRDVHIKETVSKDESLPETR